MLNKEIKIIMCHMRMQSTGAPFQSWWDVTMVHFQSLCERKPILNRSTNKSTLNCFPKGNDNTEPTKTRTGTFRALYS